MIRTKRRLENRLGLAVMFERSNGLALGVVHDAQVERRIKIARCVRLLVQPDGLRTTNLAASKDSLQF